MFTLVHLNRYKINVATVFARSYIGLMMIATVSRVRLRLIDDVCVVVLAGCCSGCRALYVRVRTRVCWGGCVVCCVGSSAVGNKVKKNNCNFVKVWKAVEWTKSDKMRNNIHFHNSIMNTVAMQTSFLCSEVSSLQLMEFLINNGTTTVNTDASVCLFTYQFLPMLWICSKCILCLFTLQLCKATDLKSYCKVKASLAMLNVVLCSWCK